MQTTSLFKLFTGLCLTATFAVACDKKETTPDPAAEAPATAEQPATEGADPGSAAANEAPAVEEAPAAEEMTFAKVGEAAPDFTLKDQEGKEVKLSDLKGKIVVLEWTNPTCPYVVRHYKDKTMATTHDALGGPEAVTWLAVNSSDGVTAEDTMAWRTAQGFTYPVLLDGDGAVGKTYKASTTPHMYIIDKEGVLRYSGAIDDNATGDKKPEEVTNYVSAAIKALAEGKEVEQAETKPYGCSVKYGS